VSIKLCDPPGLSEEAYPFRDIWAPVHRLLDAFGPERLAWASDIGRFRGRIGWSIRLPQEPYPGKHTYMESLAFFLYTDELSPSDKEEILGRSARRMLRWPAAHKTAAPA
jgi:L-fuconolactonase